MQKAVFPILASFFFLASGAPAADLERIGRSPFLAGGTQPGEFRVWEDALSADGRYLVFASSATAVLPGVLDLNGSTDIFVRDLQLGTTRLITRAAGMPSLTAGGHSDFQRLSADGNVLVFSSTARDLIPIFDVGPGEVLYWHDLRTGVTRLVCHDPDLPDLPRACSPDGLDLSADGRYVVIPAIIEVSALVPGATDTNDGRDLVVWDSTADTYELITHVPGDPLLATPDPPGADRIRISADGRFVSFDASSSALVPGDGQPPGSIGTDALIYDRQTRASQVASHLAGAPGTPSNGGALMCGMSQDGRFLLFASPATHLVAGITDLNGDDDLFLFDRTTSAVELISRRPAPAAATGNAGSRCGWLSEDGRYVYFSSRATDLVTGVTDGGSSPDLFLRDRQSGATRLLTRTFLSATQAAGGSMEKVAAVSADGKSLIFSDDATSLVNAAFTGFPPWSFRYDADLDRVELALAPAGAPNTAASSHVVALSPDGAVALFTSPAAAWLAGVAGPERDYWQLLTHQEAGNTIRLAAPAAYAGVGLPSGGTGLGPAAVAGDGSKVVFQDNSAEICGLSTSSLCILARPAGTYTNINHRRDDPQVALPERMDVADLSSPDGRFVLVESRSSQLALADTNGVADLFLYDTQSRAFELISRRQGTAGTAGNAVSAAAYLPRSVMMPDASQVVFESGATDLLEGTQDANGNLDVYLRDRAAGTTRLVSHRPGQPLAAGNDRSGNPALADLGGYVVFESAAGDLVPGFSDHNGSSSDLYLYTASSGALTLITHAAASPSQGANSFSTDSSISANGRFVAFTSHAGDLVAGVTDDNFAYDAFLFDRATGANRLLSHADGQPSVAANGGSRVQDMSSDARYVLVESSAANLLPGLPAFTSALFLLDTVDGSRRLVSHRQGQPASPVAVGLGSRMSPGAQKVFFTSNAPDVIPGIENPGGGYPLYAWERSTGRLELITSRFGDSGKTANHTCRSAGPNDWLDDGQGLLLHCSASDLLLHASSGNDLVLALFGQAFFADGFESGTTAAWSP